MVEKSIQKFISSVTFDKPLQIVFSEMKQILLVSLLFILLLRNTECYEAYACEGNSIRLDCPNAGMIEIKDARYGRNTKTLCISGPILTATCNSVKALPIIKEKCDNTPNCVLTASNNIFGDPCVGTFKYLNVSFTCRSAGADARGMNPTFGDSAPVSTMVACEGESFNLNCPIDSYLSIINANYGLSGTITCGGQTGACYSPKSWDIAIEKCEGQNSCVLRATNAGAGGDPCPGIRKYFQVKYFCKPLYKEGQTKRALACENRDVHLNCGSKKINIIHTNYGRRDSITCSSLPWSRSEITCRASDSLLKVMTRCQGNSKCDVSANNGVFGDPCSGIFKYLEVDYTCI